MTYRYWWSGKEMERNWKTWEGQRIAIIGSHSIFTKKQVERILRSVGVTIVTSLNSKTNLVAKGSQHRDSALMRDAALWKTPILDLDYIVELAHTSQPYPVISKPSATTNSQTNDALRGCSDLIFPVMATQNPVFVGF